jgi:hypothetical protein
VYDTCVRSRKNANGGLKPKKFGGRGTSEVKSLVIEMKLIRLERDYTGSSNISQEQYEKRKEQINLLK